MTSGANTSHPRLEKIVLVGLDFPKVAEHRTVELHGQYNPKEIAVKKQASWTEHKSSTSDHPNMEFKDGGARSLSFELMFDTYETGEDVQETYVATLFKLASVMIPDGEHEKDKRPSRILVVWGPDMPRFEGVIESVDVKYTMFLPNGRPVRATCNVTMKEATMASFTPQARA